MIEQPGRWRNRIVSHGTENPEQLLAHPMNARIHPRAQSKAVTSMLDTIGWVQTVIVNKATGFVVDGHLRVAEAISAGETSIPVTYVDISDDEERLIVAFYDATSKMAVVDPTMFVALTDALDIPDALAGLHTDLLGLAPDPSDLPDDSDETLPEESMSWGYATFGKTKVGCSVGEVDQLNGLWGQYKHDNDGEDAGFVAWLVSTNR